MPFPFSSSGTIEIHASGPSASKRIVLGVTSAIRNCEPGSLLVENDVVSFRAGIFCFVGNWNQLVHISSGKISSSQQGVFTTIHYRISFMQWFLVSSFMVGLVFIMGCPFELVIFFWIVVYGGKAGHAFYRFPRFLRMAAEKTISTQLRGNVK